MSRLTVTGIASVLIGVLLFMSSPIVDAKPPAMPRSQSPVADAHVGLLAPIISDLSMLMILPKHGWNLRSAKTAIKQTVTILEPTNQHHRLFGALQTASSSQTSSTSSMGSLFPPGTPMPATCVSAAATYMTINVTLLKGTDVCNMWNALKPCVQDMASVLNTQLSGGVTVGDIINTTQPVIDALCVGTSDTDGTPCSSMVDTMMAVAACSNTYQPYYYNYDTTPAPLVCPTGCSIDSQNPRQCTVTFKTSLLEKVCSSCVNNLITAAQTAALSMFALKQRMASNTVAGIEVEDLFSMMDLQSGVAMFQAMRGAFCARSPLSTLSPAPRCVSLLGLVTETGSGTKTANALFGALSNDQINDPTQYMSGTLASDICLSDEKQMCFNRIVLGYLSAMAISGRLCHGSCGEQNTILSNRMRAWSNRMARLCVKNADGKLCLGLPAEAQPMFTDCMGAALSYEQYSWGIDSTGYHYYNLNNATCNATINTTLKSWGCCGRFFLGASEVAADYRLRNSKGPLLYILNNLPPACPIPLGNTSVKKTLALGITYALVKQNATLYQETLQAIVTDVATRLGISPVFIVNAKLVDSADPSQSGPTLAPNAAGRRMRAQASTTTSAASATFDIQTSSPAMTTAASSTFDSAVSSNTMSLPSTSSVLPAGQSAAAPPVAPTTAQSATSATSSVTSVAPASPVDASAAASGVSNTVIIIIVVVAVTAVILIIVVIVVVFRNKKEPPRTAVAPMHQPMGRAMDPKLQPLHNDEL